MEEIQRKSSKWLISHICMSHGHHTQLVRMHTGDLVPLLTLHLDCTYVSSVFTMYTCAMLL